MVVGVAVVVVAVLNMKSGHGKTKKVTEPPHPHAARLWRHQLHLPSGRIRCSLAALGTPDARPVDPNAQGPTKGTPGTLRKEWTTRGPKTKSTNTLRQGHAARRQDMVRRDCGIAPGSVSYRWNHAKALGVAVNIKAFNRD